MIRVEPDGAGGARVGGALGPGDAARLRAAAAERGPGVWRLDLDELEIDDGAALAELISALRAVARAGPVELWAAPQMLAHTLYKVGELDRGEIRLVEPRSDEGRLGP